MYVFSPLVIVFLIYPDKSISASNFISESIAAAPLFHMTLIYIEVEHEAELSEVRSAHLSRFTTTTLPVFFKNTPFK